MTVSPDFFRTVGQQLLDGRDFVGRTARMRRG